MIVTTVIAIALGMAPVQPDGTVERSSDNYASRVGRYSQSVDVHGRTHLRGFNRLTGSPYELTLDRGGNVDGSVGEWTVAFRVRDAA